MSYRQSVINNVEILEKIWENYKVEYNLELSKKGKVNVSQLDKLMSKAQTKTNIENNIEEDIEFLFDYYIEALFESDDYITANKMTDDFIMDIKKNKKEN